jgi:hypothetical protein
MFALDLKLVGSSYFQSFASFNFLITIFFSECTLLNMASFGFSIEFKNKMHDKQFAFASEPTIFLVVFLSPLVGA